MAGVSRQQYSSEIRLIRVMCSGRVDLEFILRAFAKGHDGVFVGGCNLNECNYVTHGNYDALGVSYLCKKLMTHIGVNPERLRIEFMSGGDGHILVDAVNDFTAKIKELGPIGVAEGIEEADLATRLEALRRLVPYLRLVERERLRVPTKTAESYHEFWKSDAVNDLFDRLISEKLAISQIALLLQKEPLSTAQIAKRLDLKPSDVSKHMNASSRQGLVRFDMEHNRYNLA